MDMTWGRSLFFFLSLKCTYRHKDINTLIGGMEKEILFHEK